MTMAFTDLSENDRKVYEYIKNNDFESVPWSTAKAAKALGLKKDEVYESLSNLSKYIKNNIFIHYHDGAIRISAN